MSFGAWFIRLNAAAVATIFALLLGCDFSFGVENQDERMIEVFNAAIEKWRNELEFHCTFTFRENTARSKEAAYRGEFEKREAAERVEATGQLSKRGRLSRMRLDYGRPPTLVSKARNEYQNISFDGGSNGKVSAEYMLRYPGVGGSISFQPIRESPEGELGASRSGSYLLTGFSFGGGVRGSPLKIFQEKGRTGELLATRVLPQVGNDEVVEFDIKAPPASIRTQRFTFDVSKSPPVITKISARTIAATGAEEFVSDEQGFEFRECGGGSIASRVKMVMGPGQAADGGESWLVREWISEDLGKRGPMDSDFVVQVPTDTSVIGLPRGKENSYDLARGAWLPIYERPVAPVIPAEPSNLPVILGGLAILAAIVAWAVRTVHGRPGR